MTAGLEGVGDAATGAVIAGAIEPQHGNAGDGSHHGSCLNCGTALIGPFCQTCGQNSHIHRSLAGFGHDLLHGVFHFEGKIVRTLPMLLLRPGDLTRRYVAGERAKFVSPLAMFLFCVFLMFAVVGSLAGEMHAPEIRESDRHKSLAQIHSALAKNEQAMAALKEKIRAEDRADRSTAVLDAQLDDLSSDTDSLELARNFLSGGKEGEGDHVLGFKTGWATLDHGIEAANRNPNLFLYRLQSSAYKYSWALIPISTPLVWLLFFWKRQYKLYDHLVFVTFSLTFMLLLVTALILLGAIGLPAGLIVLIAMLVPPLHLYKQVRGAYLGGRTTSLLRTGVLILFGFIALLLYVLLLLVMGVMH